MKNEHDVGMLIPRRYFTRPLTRDFLSELSVIPFLTVGKVSCKELLASLSLSSANVSKRIIYSTSELIDLSINALARVVVFVKRRGPFSAPGHIRAR